MNTIKRIHLKHFLDLETCPYRFQKTVNSDYANVPEHYSMKTYGEVEMKFHTLLILALDAGGGQFHDPSVIHFPGD
jgi:hypothetical protein